ncbi:helix-turn-helix domain-containing protein [Halorubrum sp. AS12]|uniref:helix-turn-helix domain-containing protein n=1 Tax=Halorubrum sp. AS12 TaxID=3409687 RepID=UPI003DA720DE
MLNVLYYLSSEEQWTAAELTERTGHARATIYRNLRTLTNRAMATKEHSRYKLREEFNGLHLFASKLRHHVHRVRIKLKSDVPETGVCDRANVTPGVLNEHYDRRSQREKMEQRRGYLDNI